MDFILHNFANPVSLWTFIVFFTSSAISTLDKRIHQAKQNGSYPTGDPDLPKWVVIFDILRFSSLITLLILDWKFAIFVYILGFILAVLPILEFMGNILAALIIKPFMK